MKPGDWLEAADESSSFINIGPRERVFATELKETLSLDALKRTD
jgi:hypothetical protein